MDIKKSLIRPIIIGVAGATKTGKSTLRKQLCCLLKEYQMCEISLEYYKTISEEIKLFDEENNRDSPISFDFDLLFQHIEDLRNGQTVKFKLNDGKEIVLNSKPVIFIEGVLTFYDRRIRNLLDLKIFIDVELDDCLSNIISDEMSKGNMSLDLIIDNYHKFTRPVYVKYLNPSKKYADVILPQICEDSVFIPILAEYLKMQLNRTEAGDLHYLSTSQNEIIDPKYQYFDKNILVTSEDSHISFFKQVFEDVITNEEDEFLVDKIQDKLLSILIENLYTFFKEKPNFKGVIPKVDLVITEFDDLTEDDLAGYQKIIIFKTICMSEKDLQMIENILKKKKKCNIIVNSIFLAPKYAELILSNQLDTVLLNTLYFSDFLTKFEVLIRGNKKTFDPETLAQKFRKLSEVFEY